MNKKQTLLILGIAACLLAFQPAYADVIENPVYSHASQTDHPIDPAVHKDDPRIIGWATGWTEYYRSDGQTSYSDPEAALHPGGTFGVVSLGDLSADQIAAGYQPGYITLTFDFAIGDGEGYDFAVYENGFMSGGKLFAELAYVEVSTDGIHFARFDSHYYAATSPVGAYGTIDPTMVYNLAGKHQANYGTGFDLAQLANHEYVSEGLLNLNNINYIRIVDIPGSGDYLDSYGNPIFDSWVTWGSGGFDLDAVAVLNAAVVPEPATMTLLGLGLAGMALRRFRMSRAA